VPPTMKEEYYNLMAKVIDAPCGKGKTSWAIQFMNENKEKRFVFITPFLKEVKRIKTDCQGFKEPKDTNGSKQSHLKDLLDQGHNIVATHSLFALADQETMELIRMGGYTLILDEVMEVVKQEKISPHDLKMLQNDGWLIVDEDTGKVSVTEKARTYTGQFKEIIHKAQAERLVCFNDTFLIWQFPPDIFGLFDEVYILTYLFHGQIQRCYYDFHGIEYDMLSVEGNQDEGYRTVPYDPLEYDRELREWSKKNIIIHDGKLNDIGDKGLSYSWYDKHQNSNRIMARLQKNTYNFFRNEVSGKACDNMWTCFKGTHDKLKGKGYTKGFVQCGERATNEYRDKKNLAYLVNRFLNPGLVKYFQSRDVKINQDLYAVSELIQWLWRSQLRMGEPVNLYIPSKRMRGLLIDWMDGKLAPQKC
jgi:hypothetical protein